MSFLMRQVAHCDVCGHEWLTNKVPSHCAKCKSRKWNQGAALRSGVSAFFGAWPGEETDAELLKALAEVRNKPKRRKS